MKIAFTHANAVKTCLTFGQILAFHRTSFPGKRVSPIKNLKGVSVPADAFSKAVISSWVIASRLPGSTR